MRKLLQWYNKSTKNKIIIFSIIFILALGYLLLHRPISLIMWNSFRYEKEKIIALELESAMGIDKEKYLQLYYDNNIANQQVKIKNEIPKIIDNLESDLLLATLFGIEEVYLQALLNKIILSVMSCAVFDSVYNLYKNIPYTSQDLQSFNEFLNAFDKVFFFITKLSTKHSEYERYAVQIAVFQTSYITHFISSEILTQEQICSLDTISLLEKLTKAKQVYDSPELQKEVVEKGDLLWIKNKVTKTEEKLNGCK